MSKNSQEKKKEEREISKIPKISAARRGDNNVRDKLDLWITEHREGIGRSASDAPSNPSPREYPHSRKGRGGEAEE